MAAGLSSASQPGLRAADEKTGLPVPAGGGLCCLCLLEDRSCCCTGDSEVRELDGVAGDAEVAEGVNAGCFTASALLALEREKEQRAEDPPAEDAAANAPLCCKKKLDASDSAVTVRRAEVVLQSVGVCGCQVSAASSPRGVTSPPPPPASSSSSPASCRASCVVPDTAVSKCC